jgi:Fic family protein
MLHFWIGLLHPFEDGNGRLARMLFYWYMLKEGYWAFAYLTISERILKARKQYTMAYIYSEQDDNDLTYFVDYNIRKIQEAQKQFQLWLEKKKQESSSRAHLFKSDYNFNDRQTRLIHHFYQHMQEYTTVSAYKNIYSVSKGTAITDLKKLQQQGFLTVKRKGKNSLYLPTDLIKTLF